MPITDAEGPGFKTDFDRYPALSELEKVNA